MAYRLDEYDSSIVIDGWERGVSDDPYTGISDMRNLNIISIPGEASVNFATSKITAPLVTSASVTSSDAGADTITFTGGTGLENYMAISFSVVTGITGVAINTIYWVDSVTGSPATGCKLYTDYQMTALVNITADGTGTFSSININQPKHFAKSRDGSYWTVDLSGRVWSNTFTTISYYWTYTGNKVPTTATVGNGLVYYQASDGTGYMFVFHNGSIDYTLAANGVLSWVYGWKWNTDGSAYGYAATPTQTLKSGLGSNNSHEAITSPDNRVYFVDANYVGRFYQTVPGTAFLPTDTTTYTYDQNAILPFDDIGQCITYLGTNVLIGGEKNVVYPWDRVTNKYNFPIFIAENNIAKMVTVNTNTYIFAGNRGRIYITNGSNAALYKKIPDHISNTVEPYFTWGGATFNKNQLYFSFSSTNNASISLTTYGGVWAIDTDTQALRITNKLSFATYAGLATALIGITGTNPTGTGLFMGWNSGASTYGIDKGASTPYTSSEASVDSDLIPIGTFQKPRDFERVEYKLTKPMVSGESVSVYYRTDFSQSYTLIFTDSTVGNFSNSQPVNFKNAQWIQFQIVLNSTGTTPSYTRLKEIRITGIK